LKYLKQKACAILNFKIYIEFSFTCCNNQTANLINSQTFLMQETSHIN